MQKYNIFWRRFWANVIDAFVIYPFTFLDRYVNPSNTHKVTLIAWLIFSNAILFIYSIYFHGRFGQTLGKMATKIKVLDVSEERIPNYLQAFQREIIYIFLTVISLINTFYLIYLQSYSPEAEFDSKIGQIVLLSTLGCLIIEFITMFFNLKSRALHDFIAGTVVIQNEQKLLKNS